MSNSILEGHTRFQIKKVESNFREEEEIAGSGSRVDMGFPFGMTESSRSREQQWLNSSVEELRAWLSTLKQFT